MNQKIDLKVVILGRSNAGKSSLMEKYLTSRFQIKNNSTVINLLKILNIY
jgi:GTPase SAR1 family protein